MRRIVVILIGLVLSGPTFAGPGEGGGGGKIVFTGGRPELLDIYILKKLYPNLRPISVPGQLLPETSALHSRHLESLTMNKIKIVEQAFNQLSVWGPNAPPLILALRQALLHGQIYYTDYRIGFQDPRHWIPKELLADLPPSRLKTIAFYAKGWGLLISKRDFESLDQLNQIALLYHEGIRHLQIYYGYSISEHDLQLASVALAIGANEFPLEVQNQLRTIYDLGSTSERAETVNAFKQLRDKSCAFIFKIPRNLKNEFAAFSNSICQAELLEMNLTRIEGARRIEALHYQLSSAHTAMNILETTSRLSRGFYDPFRELSDEVSKLRVPWSSGSPEARAALRTLKDMTLTLHQQPFNSAIKHANQNLPSELSFLLGNYMKQLLVQGILLEN